MIAPELQRRAHIASTLLPSIPTRVVTLMQMVLASVLGMERSAAIAEAVHEISVLLWGAAFLLTPTPIATIGLLLLALGGPMLRSIEILLPASTSQPQLQADPRGCRKLAAPNGQAAAVLAVVHSDVWRFKDI